MTIRVLIVDDSALMRSLLSEIINQAPDMEVAGTAANAFAAKEMVIKLSPDLITLDIEMPEVSGLTFLDRLMKAKPTPVLMISSLTAEGAKETMQAKRLGAVDFISKPKLDIENNINTYKETILRKMREVARKRPHTTGFATQISTKNYKLGSDKIIAIGASTGGTEAIRQILKAIPNNSPPIVITQHMPANFTATFAERLNELCELTVVEAKNDTRILQGHVYVAPGNLHMGIHNCVGGYVIKLDDGEAVSGHKPSVDFMFSSLAKCAANKTIACILTGMGRDGAKGMKELHAGGAKTIAQDEQSSIVFGMPKAAIEEGGANEVVALSNVSNKLLELASSNSS